MAKFTFRLQTVLEHKQRLEELAQLEHAQAQAAQVREESALQRLLQTERETVSELERQRFTGRLDIDSLQLGLGYLDVLKIQLQRQEQVVLRVRKNTDTKRDQLIQRMQERKALERLRERQRTAFVVEQNRIEANELDDLVIMRHARTMLDRTSNKEIPHAS